MARSQRIAILVAGVVAVVVAFVVLSPGDDSSDTTPTTTTTPAATTDTHTTDTTPATTPAKKAPAANVPLLTSGKVREIKVSKGDVVRFRVSSSVAEEVHVHGYDIKADVPAGGTTRLAFKAKIEGVFEIEFEGSHTQIGKLVVEP